MKQLGLAIFALGVIAIVAVLFIDTTVPTGSEMYERVYNLGLMQEKQNLLIISVLIALVGSIMIVGGSIAQAPVKHINRGHKTAIYFAWVIVAVAGSLLIYKLIPQNQPELSATTFHATDITGATFARDFELPDHHGQTRRLADFRGKVVALFFGYTHCPDVCPTTLTDFAQALKSLGPDAAKVQVLFVTVDPERDTPALLKQFVPAFNPTFLGLHPDAVQLKAVTQEFKVVHQKTATQAPGEYLVDHSAGTYIFDPQGRIRLLMPYGSKPTDIARDLKTLLAS